MLSFFCTRAFPITLDWTSSETDATRDAAWGDYDGDGDLDFAAANYIEQNRVYKNTGGSFSAVWSSVETEDSSSVSWVDCDADGDLDLAVSNESAQNIIYGNDGGDSFSGLWSSTSGDTTYAFSWADYDDDGDLDFVEANFDGNRVYRNNGNCEFISVWTGPDEISYSVKWADFNRDGLQDIVSGNSGSNDIFTNNGNNTFTTTWTSVYTSTTLDIGVVDYNIDGYMDLHSVNSSFSMGQANRVFRNNGDDTFNVIWTETASGSTYTPSYESAWGDWSGDGLPDMAVANTDISGMADFIYLNSGTGPFYFSEATPEKEGSRSVAFGDYDGDGDIDLLVGNYSEPNRIYGNSAAFTNNPPAAPVATTISDGSPGAYVFNWSEPIDDITSGVALTYVLRLGLCTTCEDTRPSSFSPPYGLIGPATSTTLNISVPGTYYWSVAAVDNTGFSQSSWSGEDSFIISAAFSTVWSSVETAMSATVAPGDIDGDGDLDVYVTSLNSVNYLYENDNATNTFTMIWSTLENDASGGAAFGDYDGDGDLDILTGNNSAGQNRLYENDGVGGFSLVWSSIETDDTGSITWADCDNDGDQDQITAVNGANVVYINYGSTSFSSVWSSTETDASVYAAVLDYDKDGIKDIAVANASATQNRVYKGNGDCSFSVVWSSVDTNETYSVAWTDFDNDGDDDILAGNVGTANIIYENIGGNSFNSGLSTPESDLTYRYVPGDYDSDGDVDILALNNGANRVYRNDGGAAITLIWTSSESDVTYGGEWSDFDNDGDIDFYAANDGVDRFYLNDIPVINSAPSSPTVTSVSDILSSVYPTQVDLYWSAGSDDLTSDNSLTYQFRIGTCSGCDDVVSEFEPLYGGNAGASTSAYIKINATGTYYWSVATIDKTGYSKSSWSAEDSFAVKSTVPCWTMWESSTSYDVYDAEWGDYDGDGDLDILTAGVSGGVVFRNDGGTFPNSWSEAGPTFAGSASWGDYDKDGDLDLSVEDKIFRNDGSDTFTLVWSATESNETMDSIFFDYDSDGDLDLAIANNLSYRPSRLYRNDGGGSFVDGWNYPAAYSDQSYSVDATDYDGDGNPDLLFGNYGQADRIFRNVGGGLFSLAWSSPYIDDTGAARWMDYDGDGDREVVAAPDGDSLRIYHNYGSTSFTQTWTSSETSSFSDVSFGDFDGDGDLDIIASSQLVANGDILYRNDAVALFTAAWTSEFQSMGYGVRFGDADGDGDLDILSASRSYSSSLYPTRVIENNLDPSNAAPSAPTPNNILDQYYGNIRLRWSAATDDSTPADLLTYHVKVGTCSGCYDVLSESFYPPDGNAGASTTHYINLNASATYYWSVAAVDASGFEMSSWSTEDSFNLFTPPHEAVWYSTELENSNDIAWGDFDGDGDIDHVVANYQGAKRVYDNTGTGFTSVWASTDLNMSNDVVVGDYDGDGDLDFFISNTSSTSKLYRNDGGSFTNSWSTSSSVNSQSSAFGDIDNDGDIDLLITVYNGANSLYRNDGGDLFTSIWTSTETNYTNSALIVDLDSDGYRDIICGDGGSGPLVYKNNSGDGTFSTPATMSDANSVRHVSVGDFDGDGDPDFNVANTYHENRVYRNDGNMSFALAWSTPSVDYSKSAFFGDYDQDGDIDIVVGNYLAKNRIYANNNNGTFSLVWSSPNSDSSIPVEWGDYDGDGDLDHISGNVGQSNIVYRNNINITNSAPSAPTITAEPDGPTGNVTLSWSAAADDITPTAQLSYIVRVGTCSGCDNIMSGAFAPPYSNAGASTSVTLYLADDVDYYWSVAAIDKSGFSKSAWSSEDSFLLQIPVFTSVWNDGGTDDSRDAAWGDYDGDGDLDFIVANYGAPCVLYRNDGSMNFSAAWSTPESDNSQAATWADIDNDGDLDIIIANAGADRAYENNSGTFSLVWSSWYNNKPFRSISTMDTDHDGLIDVAFAGNNMIYIYENFLIKYTISDPMDFPLEGPLAGTQGIISSDFNNDGFPDLYVYTSTGFFDSIYTGSSPPMLFSPYWTSPLDQNTYSAVAADFDGDGDFDVFTANNGGGNIALSNDGNASFSAIWTSTETDDSMDVAWGDIDGDGDIDVIAANGPSNPSRYYRNDGGSFALAWSFSDSVNTYSISLADADGDGDLDALRTDGGTANIVFENLLSPTNAAPAAPVSTAVADATLLGATVTVNFAWEASSDDVTPSAALRYNLRVGSCTGCDNIVSGVFSPPYANNFNSLSKTLILSATGTFYWSVTAMDDAGYLVSSESAEDSFNIIDPPSMLSLQWSSVETNSTRSLAWGDYDGDGDLDIIGGNYAAGDQLYKNNGGSFEAIWNSLLSDNTTGVAFCDIDNDGDLDFGTSVDGSENRFFRNDGLDSFSLAWSSVELDSSTALACSDLDSDGDIDVAVANGGSGESNRIYANNGSGSFTLSWSSTETDNSSSARIIDADRDGNIDIVFGNTGGTDISKVYFNDGSGQFSPLSLPTALYVSSISVADLNEDGYQDLVLGTNGGNEKIAVYRNDSGSSFSSIWTSITKYVTSNISTADYDGDGMTDIFAANGSSTSGYSNYVFQQTSSFSFNPYWASTEQDKTLSSAWGDYDGDGDLDLVAGNVGANRLYRNDLSIGNTAPSAPVLQTSLGGELSGAFLSVIFDWDDAGDDITNPNSMNYLLRVGTCSGCADILSPALAYPWGNVVSTSSAFLNISSPGTYYWSVSAVDNSGFATSSWSSEETFSITNPSSVPFGKSWNAGSYYSTSKVGWTDLDGDGDLDLLTANSDTADFNRIYQNQGNGNFTASWTSSLNDSTMGVAFADADNDGDIDIFIGNYGQLNRLYKNTGSGQFSIAWNSPESDNTGGVAAGDFDRDGLVDFIVANDGSSNRLYRNRGSDTYSTFWSSVEIDATKDIEWCDIDNDGDLDFVTANSAQPNAFYRNSNGAFASAWVTSESDDSTAVDCPDYDGDYDTDVVFSNGSGQPNRLYHTYSNFNFILMWTGSEPEDSTDAIHGDYDGDGDMDLLFTSESQPDRIYNNTNTGSFSLSWSSQETEASLSAAFGDYDSDGDLDIAIGVNGSSNYLYRNNLDPTNDPPQAPVITPINNQFSDGGATLVRLSWSAPLDDNTPTPLLNYQVRMGTCQGCDDILSSAFVPPYGNARASNTEFISISQKGTYFWAVSAIDSTGFSQSGWSLEDDFTITDPTQSGDLVEGWNLISFPSVPSSQTLAQMTSNTSAISDTFYYYNTIMSLGASTTVELGKGYWAYSETSAIINPAGTVTDAASSVEVTSVKRGWNMLGNPYADFMIWGNNISVDCGSGNLYLGTAVAIGDVSAKAYVYDGSAYVGVSLNEAFAPWQGFFIKVNKTSCKITMTLN